MGQTSATNRERAAPLSRRGRIAAEFRDLGVDCTTLAEEQRIASIDPAVFAWHQLSSVTSQLATQTSDHSLSLLAPQKVPPEHFPSRYRILLNLAEFLFSFRARQCVESPCV